MDDSPAGNNNEPLGFKLARRIMKTLLSEANRSALFYLLVSNLPVKRASGFETGFDLLGVLILVSLSAGILILMRFILTN
jgi:hypothetical protein